MIALRSIPQVRSFKIYKLLVIMLWPRRTKWEITLKKSRRYFWDLSGNFTCLEVIFKFRRRLGYYLFHTYIPTCLIVMMSWISFWIKPEAVPARVTLGVTSLLTLSTQHANSQKSLPPVSYIKVSLPQWNWKATIARLDTGARQKPALFFWVGDHILRSGE